MIDFFNDLNCFKPFYCTGVIWLSILKHIYKILVYFLMITHGTFIRSIIIRLICAGQTFQLILSEIRIFNSIQVLAADLDRALSTKYTK